MKKYINLIVKDILIYKKLIFFLIYLPLALFFIPSNSLQSLLHILIGCIIFVVIPFFSFYQIEEEKNKGIELFTTTSYSRKDIVISKYLLYFFVAVVQIILICVVVFLSNLGLLSFSIFSVSTILLFVSVMASIQIPLSFQFKSITFSIISVIFSSLVMLAALVMNVWVKKVGDNHPPALSITFIFISVILIIISVFVSNKIYFKKDL